MSSVSNSKGRTPLLASRARSSSRSSIPSVEKPFYFPIYVAFVTYVCVPAVRKLFTSFLSKSSEKLFISIPSVEYSEFFGAKTDEANNNDSSKTVFLTITNPIHFCWLMLLDEKMGLGETYMAGDWTSSPNLTDLLRLLIRAKRQTTAANKSEKGNRASKSTAYAAFATILVDFVRKIAKSVSYFQHWIRENSLTQSTKNIQEHYDLGNEMFKLFLDKSMTYSCALFEEVQPVTDNDFDVLEKAQYRKIDRLIDQLGLKAEDHVLEVGFGWGSAAIRAVQRSGCKWTGITISKEQLELGKQRVVEAGLESRIDLQFQDYRLVTQKYTHVLSIEMLEAVGEKYLAQYFQIINDVLEYGGVFALQTSICRDEFYDRYKSSSDFVRKYIFPGGHLPSLEAIAKSLPPTLKETSIFRMGQHYSMTLEHWFYAWMHAQKEIETRFTLPSDFHRRWQFYFCICNALFTYGNIDVVQMTFKKEKN